ncbi:MAG TPA: flagellar biosynthesis protein FlhF [Steroidobacteraceae bacterium]|nr:flagellar biosynthesis protein FlhF [Steroidobacteraceae bacterium]
MKIKRYTAVSMRAALALVRAEQGPDAVILSSRRGDDGIEVIAAVDYDEALFVEATRQRTPAPVIPPQPVAPAVAPVSAHAPVPASAPAATLAPAATQVPAATPVPAAAPAPAAPPADMRIPTLRPALSRASAAARPDPGLGAMHRELQDLRQLVETGLAGMAWNDKRLRDPVKTRILEDLSMMDIAPDVAMALANCAPQRTASEGLSHVPLALLVKHLPVLDDLSAVSGGILAVAGPTGAGKTTTIAKLAAHWCMQHGSQDLALVSTDGYRIGGRDQLLTYARILGAPMYPANSGMDLARVLGRLKSKKLVLIDTAGMGPRDLRLAEQLAALQLGAARARVLLALPAQGEGHALEEIVQAYSRLNPVACIVTKVDEAASLGALISTTLRHRLKIAYVCDGQRVPEDLHPAHEKRIWLVSAAHQMKIGAAPRGEAYYARNFGRAPAHA